MGEYVTGTYYYSLSLILFIFLVQWKRHNVVPSAQPLLYDHMIRAKSGAPGLSLVPKLKYEQVILNSFSKMTVDLATQVSRPSLLLRGAITSLYMYAYQVLSQSVANALKLTGGDEVTETVDKFDKFFDCVNVSSLSAGKLSRNAFKSPFRSPNDFRLKSYNK